jgi:DNA-binding response OmpR family regulator
MGHRILICDDEPHIALAVGMKFRNAGFEVLSARNGQEAWGLIVKSPPSLLITDCTMPRMDGLELCRRIRAIAELRSMPIFLLTARGLELDPVVVTDELRISKMILKPFSPRELYHDVQTALQPAAKAAAVMA